MKPKISRLAVMALFLLFCFGAALCGLGATWLSMPKRDSALAGFGLPFWEPMGCTCLIVGFASVAIARRRAQFSPIWPYSILAILMSWYGGRNLYLEPFFDEGGRDTTRLSNGYFPAGPFEIGVVFAFVSLAVSSATSKAGLRSALRVCIGATVGLVLFVSYYVAFSHFLGDSRAWLFAAVPALASLVAFAMEKKLQFEKLRPVSAFLASVAVLVFATVELDRLLY